MPDSARLIGWQCGFEPMFVAVWSYFGTTEGHVNRLSDDEAVEIAPCCSCKWFAGAITEPDYII